MTLEIAATSDQNYKKAALTISPNLANSSVMITCSLEQSSIERIELLNKEGMLIQSVCSEKLAAGENKIHVDTASFHSGLYYVNVSSGDKTKLTKFTVVP